MSNGVALSSTALENGLQHQHQHQQRRYCSHNHKARGSLRHDKLESKDGVEEATLAEGADVGTEGLLALTVQQRFKGQPEFSSFFEVEGVKAVMQHVLGYLGHAGMPERAAAEVLEERRMLQAIETHVRKALMLVFYKLGRFCASFVDVPGNRNTSLNLLVPHAQNSTGRACACPARC